MSSTVTLPTGSIGTNALAAGAVDATKLAAGAVTADKIYLASGIQSMSNTGNAGGTVYYINLGGLKLLWSNGTTINTSTTATQFNFTLPSGFFTSIKTATAAILPLTADSKQQCNVASESTSNIGVYAWAANAATAKLRVYVIGV